MKLRPQCYTVLMWTLKVILENVVGGSVRLHLNHHDHCNYGTVHMPEQFRLKLKCTFWASIDLTQALAQAYEAPGLHMPLL